jgi:hypothetical protein
MSWPQTQAELRTRVRERAGFDSAGAGTAVADTMINRLLQASAASLYDLIVSAYGEDYFASSTTLTILANTAAVALPANFSRALGVDAVFGTEFYPITTFPFHERTARVDAWAVDALPRYRLFGNQLIVMPTPPSNQPLTLHYVPICPNLALLPFDSINGWDEWIVIDCAIKLRTAEESSVNELERQLERETARIVTAAPQRDLGEPQRVLRIRRRTRSKRWYNEQL